MDKVKGLYQQRIQAADLHEFVMTRFCALSAKYFHHLILASFKKLLSLINQMTEI